MKKAKGPGELRFSKTRKWMVNEILRRMRRAEEEQAERKTQPLDPRQEKQLGDIVSFPIPLKKR